MVVVGARFDPNGTYRAVFALIAAYVPYATATGRVLLSDLADLSRRGEVPGARPLRSPVHGELEKTA